MTLVLETLEGRSLLNGSAVIDWQMAPRFGADRRGEVALPNTTGYANPAGGFTVLLDASDSKGILPRSSFTWTIAGASGTPTILEGKQATVDLPEGTYSVRLEADHLRGSRRPSITRTTIDVNDILVVSIGDSYASGEGDPVRPGYYVFRSPRWAASPNPAMNLENANAHRSTLAGPAQFALALERDDPHTSVTFVSVANSGATIDRGLLGPMPSIGDKADILPAEVDEVRQIVGDRPIDVLTVSIGGNDVGFSSRIEELTTNTLRGTPTLDAIQADTDAALANLPAQYAKLDTALDGLGPGQVLITEYPDLSRDDQGRFAAVRVAGITAIDAAGTQFASEDIVAPLNRTIQAAASANGWTYVDGIFSDFRTHGYPARNSWVRGVGESYRKQGDRFGTFHPNEAGHRAIASRLQAAYRRPEAAGA